MGLLYGVGNSQVDICGPTSQKVCDALTNRIELLQKCIDKKRICSFY